MNMSFDAYFKDPEMYKRITNQINSDSKLCNLFQSALEQFSRSTDFKKALGLTTDFDMGKAGTALVAIKDQITHIQKQVSPMQTALVGSALSSGFKFDGVGDKLLSVYEPMLRQYRLLVEAQTSVRKLVGRNTAFASLLKTSVYIPGNTALDSVSGITLVQTAFSKTAETSINTSWLKADNPWKAALDSVMDVESFGLIDSNIIFSKLIDAESQTAKLLENTKFNTEIISTAAQLASILESSSVRTQGIAKLVADYGDFALSQHKGIQVALNAGRDDDAKWRLGLLDVTSKFVDRQVIWESGIDAVAEEIRFDNYSGFEDIGIAEQHESEDEESDIYDFAISNYDEDAIGESTQSFLSIIPQEIGYTKRTDSKIGTLEGFEKSKIVRITELGKSIVENIRRINQESEDRE
jgi:hypothetical protein